MCETDGCHADSNLDLAGGTVEDDRQSRVYAGFSFGEHKQQMSKKSRPPKKKPHQSAGKSSVKPAAVSDDRPMVWGVCFFLAAITFAVFGQTLGHGFVNYDDDRYVYDNPLVLQGLTRAGITRAFTYGSLANWDPITTLSHMLDCQLYGLHAGGHHLTNLLLHTASVILLFLVLRKMTAALWRSAFVAAVFALHPLHVESVAWVAERKDALSGFFFMLTLWAYVRYVKGPPKTSRYLMVLVWYALGLMSKTMLTTLPFVLLLLDAWPLGRIDELRAKAKGAGAILRSRVVLEKLPLLALSLGSCLVAVATQGRAVKPLAEYPFGLRVANAVVSFVIYIWQMLWPVNLAVLYPYPSDGLPALEVGAAALVLAAISAAAWHWRRTRPYLLTGWLWYVGMLVPVIGLVQIGAHGHADRYTYLPQIGLYLALTWLAGGWFAGWRHRRMVLGCAAGAVLAALGVAAFIQTTYWQDGESLWKHTIACTTGNAIAHNNLAGFDMQMGRVDEALAEFQKAVDIHPDYAQAHCNLGTVLMKRGRNADAVAEFQKAYELEPGNPNYSGNLGNALLQGGRLDEAIAAFQKSLAIREDNVEIHNNYGFALFREGRVDEAIPHLLTALKLSPGSEAARNNLAGVAWMLAASPNAAARNGPKAVELAEAADRSAAGTDPVMACVLAGAYAEAGRFPEAVATAQRSLQLATAQTNAALVAGVQEQLGFYQSHRPFRDAALQTGAAQGTQ